MEEGAFTHWSVLWGWGWLMLEAAVPDIQTSLGRGHVCAWEPSGVGSDHREDELEKGGLIPWGSLVLWTR